MANKRRTFRIRSNGKGDYPASDKIKSRISTVTRSMASTLVPRIGATYDDRRKMVVLLYGITDENEIKEKLNHLTCVYCGEKATGLDHLHPLINGKTPTGYFTEPANLVPCCSSCNEKKGNDEWEVFMNKTEEKFKYLNEDGKKEERIARLKEFVKNMPATKLELPAELKRKYKQLYISIEKELGNIQDVLAKEAELLLNLLQDKQ